MKRQRADVAYEEVEEEEEEEVAPAAPVAPVGPSSWIGHAPSTLVPVAKGSVAMAMVPAPITPPKSAPATRAGLPYKAMPASKAAPIMAPPARRAPGPPTIGLPHLVPAGTFEKTVNVWPTGLEMLNIVKIQFHDHVQRGAPGRFHPARQAVLAEFKELLDDEERQVADMCHMVIVDARGPTSAKPIHGNLLLGHVGTHPEILQQVLDSEEFITDIGRQLRDQWPQDPDTSAIGVLVFCKSGKHRSVAWSYLIQALMCSYGYHSRVSQAAMNVSGTCAQRCQACQMPTPHSIMTQAIVKLSMVDAV